MKILSLTPLAMLLAACASSQEQAATGATAPTQPAATAQSTAAVDPVGVYEFSTIVDGQTLTGTMHIEGSPAAYKGRIITTMLPEIPIVSASVQANTINAIGSLPDGDLLIRMVMDGMNFKGTWSLGSDGGDMTGKKLPK